MMRLLLFLVFLSTIFWVSEHACRAQNLELTNADDFRNCVEGDDSEFKLVIRHTSDIGGFEENSYSLDWGDGSEGLTQVSYDALNTQHMYTRWGVFPLTVSAVSKQTRQKVERVYKVINLSKPAIGFEKGLSGIPCVNSEAEIFVTGFKDNTENTVYHLDFGDGEVREYTQAQIVAENGKVLHTYQKTHCQLGHPEGITIRVTARNECAFENAMEYPEYVIILPPTADFTYVDQPGCTRKEITFINQAEEGLGKNCEPLKLKYEWDFGKEGVGTDQMNAKNPVVVYEEAGTYPVTLTVKNSNGFKCGNATKTIPVEIIESVKADFSIPLDESCEPLNGLVFMDLSEGDLRTWRWTVTEQGACGGYTPVSLMTDANAKIDFTYGTYRVVQTVSNSCSSDSRDTVIRIKKDPEVRFEALEAICPDDILSLTSQVVSYAWYNNKRAPRWEIEPATGWKTVPGSKLTDEYPQIRFTTPGEYTLTVTLPGAGCGGTRLTASQTLKVYQPEVDLKEMVADKTEMCEGEVLTVTGEPLGEIQRVLWEVRRENVLTAVQPEEAVGKWPFIISGFGNYQIKARVKGVCRSAEKDFDVRVFRAPEIVALTGFPEHHCPKEEFYPGVDLNYNGNEPESVVLKWEVLQNGAVTDKADVIGENTLRPKIRFSAYGEYEIRLTLTAATACDPRDKLSVSKVLNVVNPQLDMDIQADQTEICVNGVMTFTNHTSAIVTPQYFWTVTPGTEGVDYAFTGGTGATDEAPQILFKTSGIYNVGGYIQGACAGKLFPFTVAVKQDPELTIDVLEPICPGELVLNDAVVHYHWNDDWNGGAESGRKVEWSLTAKPANAEFTPYTSPEWDKYYPVLELKTPGTYVLQARLASAAGCGGELVASQTVTVYDPSVTVDITPRTNETVKWLEEDKWQTLQGETMEIENKSTGIGLTYRWRVTPAEQVTIVDPDSEEPQITFGKPGIYQIRADITGTCRTAVKEFTAVVRGIPAFVLDSLPDRCDHTVDVLDLKEYLHCDSAGNHTIRCQWSITPDDGSWATVENTVLTDMMPRLKFTKNGIYTLTLSATAEYGGTRQYSGRLRVLNSEVTAGVELSASAGCTTDERTGMPLTLTNRALGDSLTWEWEVVPAEGWNGDLTVKHPHLNFTEQGDYKITLRVRNICKEDTKTKSFRAYAKPEITRLTAEDLGRQCDREYYFKGTDHLGTIETNNDALVHVLWQVTPAGASFINGTAEQDEYPDIQLTGNQNYTITGEFANHCKDTVRLHYTVQMDKFERVHLTPVEPLCAMSDSVLLQAAPAGGSWTVREAGMLTEPETGKFYFHPNRNEDLVVWAFYEKGNGTCYDRDSLKIKVRQLPVVDAGSDIHACLNEEVLELKGSIPEDLPAWKGVGVTDQKWFDPRLAGEGRVRLEYHYTDPATLCSNLDTLFVTVYGLPDASFRVSDMQCRGIDSLFIPAGLGRGNRFIWDFGNEVIREGGDSAYVYHYPVSGEYQVRLTAISAQGCEVAGEPVEIEVLDLPPADGFTVVPADTAGCGPHDVTPVVDPAVFSADHLRLSYVWDYGNGNKSTDLVPVKQTYQGALFDTTYQMIFRAYNVCGEHRDTAVIGVWSAAVAHFTINPDRPDGFCTPAEPFFINGSTGSGNIYTWDFAGLGMSHAVDTSYTFATGNATSDFTVTLLALNRCNMTGSRTQRTLKVKPNPIMAGFSMSRKYLCAGDTVFLVNNSVDREPDADKMLLYKWDFGDGEIAGVWDACHRYSAPGAYGITLSLDNGCARREFTDSVFVYVLPELQLEGNAPVCEDSELEFTVSSPEPLKNVVWNFGDGSPEQSGPFTIKHAFAEPGFYEVKVKGEANQIPACPGETVKTVEIWSKPRVKIAPLDTMACPPLLYKPEITATSYDYFTWDYGDGTPETSEMEHLYTNDTNVIQSYPVTVYVENNLGCKEEHHGLVRVYNGPEALLEKEVQAGHPEKVRFINLSRDYSEAVWYLPFSTPVFSQADQTVTFEDRGVYPLSLAVVNKYGCRDSVNMEHRSYESGLYFPNSFIPHSANGKVNRFSGIGIGLKEYKLEIFDMYGNKIWETRALEGGMPSEGWDGRNKEGKLLPQGTYVWRAEAVFFDEDVWTGKNNRSGKPQTTQGTVLLLRK